MPDRKKVIEGLQCCTGHDEDGMECDCGHCPYNLPIAKPPDCKQLELDALSLLKEQEEEIENLKQTAQSMMEGICLLKEQEPASPTWSNGKAYCGKCGQRLPRKRADREINYCNYCGQAVKWE